MKKISTRGSSLIALLLGTLAVTTACKEDDDAGGTAAEGTGASTSGGTPTGGARSGGSPSRGGEAGDEGGDAGDGPGAGGLPAVGGTSGGTVTGGTGGLAPTGGTPGSGGGPSGGATTGGAGIGGIGGTGGLAPTGGTAGEGGAPAGGGPAGGTAGAAVAGAPGSGGDPAGGSAGAPSGGAGGSVAGAGAGGVANGGTAGAADCLAADDGMVGAGGGTCEVTRCGDESSATYRTCNWLWQNARFSVFQATLTCIRDTPDFCDAQAATVAACEASVFPRACAAPGAIVGDEAMDCADVAASCSTISEQECSVLMSVLQDDARDEAYACYFLTPHPALEDCSAVLRGCVGVPQ